MVLTIINYHMRHVEVFWRSKETISGHKLYFWQLSAKWQVIFWWFLAILGPVEYSTGLKSAKYHPESIFMNLPPFQKKWGKLGRGCPWPTAKYVGICQIPKIAYFAKVLFLLLFWATPCCFSKSLKSELFLNIYIVGQILNRKKVMALWKSDSGAVFTYFWWFRMSKSPSGCFFCFFLFDSKWCNFFFFLIIV